jgi:hypothetical protein
MVSNEKNNARSVGPSEAEAIKNWQLINYSWIRSSHYVPREKSTELWEKTKNVRTFEGIIAIYLEEWKLFIFYHPHLIKRSSPSTEWLYSDGSSQPSKPVLNPSMPEIPAASLIINELPELSRREFDMFLSNINKIDYGIPDGRPKETWKMFYGKTLSEAQRVATEALTKLKSDSIWTKAWTATSNAAKDATLFATPNMQQTIKVLAIAAEQDMNLVLKGEKEIDEAAVARLLVWEDGRMRDAEDVENQMSAAKHKECLAVVIAASSVVLKTAGRAVGFKIEAYHPEPVQMKEKTLTETYTYVEFVRVPDYLYTGDGAAPTTGYITHDITRTGTRIIHTGLYEDVMPYYSPEKVVQRDALIFSERRASADAALMARLIVLKDLDFAGKEQYTKYATEIMEVWNKGYFLAGDANGVLYVYGVGKPPEGITKRTL